MNWGGFNPQPDVQGRGLRLRPLSFEDRDALYAAASDPLIWEQHPANTRHRRDVFFPYFDTLIATGAALAVIDTAENRIIGTSSYYLTDEDPPGASIGFTFLERRYWGGATNATMKKLMLDHLFSHFDTAWLHVNHGNLRSQRATAKLGAKRVGLRVLDLGGGPTEYITFRLPRAVWMERAPG